MSKIPAGKNITMPLKSYHRAKITPTIAAALALHATAPLSSRDFHSSSHLITSFLGEGKQQQPQQQSPQHLLFSNVTKFQKLQSYRSCSSSSSNDSVLPSHIKVNLPALSPTMESGTIVSWQKKEGDKLEEGDLLCEIETDKATMGFETPEEGYLAKILISEGTKDISIGKLLCIIVSNKEDIAKFENYESEIPSEPAPPAVAGKTIIAPPKESLHSVAPQPADPIDIAVIASPFAKELAEKQGVDLHGVIGSGPDGKVLASDIISGGLKPQSSASSNVEGFVDLPISPLRQNLAKKLVETKFNIPHYYLTSEILLENVLLVKEKLNNLLEKTATKTGKKNSKSLQKLTVEDFVLKAAALACLKVPETNSFYMGTDIRQNQTVNISIAVNTGHGFVTPVIKNADTKGLVEINKEISDYSKRAISGEILPHEFENGTFTISSTKFFGNDEINNFSAILNPPQACNLAIGKSTKKLFSANDREITSITNLTVTLSCDHRIVDGAKGAEWLKNFKEYLENPQLMLF
uniref:Dihydrolipoamide acetyltransferase component of pyruvate dehydrogenase complex n=1 Tax=Panagrolaimus sp. PS1159 TaxID=55785 RepID=A0AC35FR22_9BILA